MPVLEVVLAAVGLSVGGPRAWRKLRGLPEEDEIEVDAGPASPRGSPRVSSSPRKGDMNDDSINATDTTPL
eukprot:CAMPEP_0173104230 /NCGR_PEP_ID=MMETSP1102-20130122/39066_1 /TAXON_ID=49646 /ORGANISM="Geminigera sp., Strain Caron Lab Isolate" /LENGTH=70 /DNA_ID=CAMNT_0013999605 /DNA_START=175 /DNA_END=384 /DNA_ORIENTATION=+